MCFEADLFRFNERRDTRTIDPNLFYHTTTGDNVNPAAVNGVAIRPNTTNTQVAYFVSTGHRDQTQLSKTLNARPRDTLSRHVPTHRRSPHPRGPAVDPARDPARRDSDQ